MSKLIKIITGPSVMVAAMLGMVAPAHAYSFIGCPSTFFNSEFPYSGIATGVTSCAFAENVRSSYVRQPTRGVPTMIEAYSPVTGQQYVLTCTPAVATVNGLVMNAVQCAGGDAAAVVLYLSDTTSPEPSLTGPPDLVEQGGAA